MTFDRSPFYILIHLRQYADILCSVIALSKLYDLQDPRLSQITVRGDLIVPQSDRIMTRSRARNSRDPFLHSARHSNKPQAPLSAHLNPSAPPSLPRIYLTLPSDPDQYTMVPASLKILKVLIEELVSASGAGTGFNSTGAATELPDDEDDENDDWEDDPNELDLGLGSTKAGMLRLLVHFHRLDSYAPFQTADR